MTYPLQDKWRELAQAKKVTARDMLCFQVLKGINSGTTPEEKLQLAKKYVDRSFISTANRTKVFNGALPWFYKGFTRTVTTCQVEEWLSGIQLKELRDTLNRIINR